jgi:hypothetical protein
VEKSSGRFSTDENRRFSRVLRQCLWESLRLSAVLPTPGPPAVGPRPCRRRTVKKKRRGTLVPRRHEPRQDTGRELLRAAARPAASRAAAAAAAALPGRGLEAGGRALAAAARAGATGALARARLTAAAAVALRTTTTDGGHEGHEAQGRPEQETVHGKNPRLGTGRSFRCVACTFPADMAENLSSSGVRSRWLMPPSRNPNRCPRVTSREGGGAKSPRGPHPPRAASTMAESTERGGRFSSARRRRESAPAGSGWKATPPGIPG